MPKGFPLTRSLIQFSSTANFAGFKPTAPSTPKPPAFVTSATTSRQCEKAKSGNSIPSFLQSLEFIISLPRNVVKLAATRLTHLQFAWSEVYAIE